MKKCFNSNNNNNNIIIIMAIICIIFIIFDYLNLPSFLGLDICNINWGFCMGMLNIVVVLMLYSMTYKKLDKKTVERENNKKQISILLIKQCYEQSEWYVNNLTEDVVKTYIIPKCNFNSTENKITRNLQDSPFENEYIIMDLVKDGQINKERIEKYFEIKSMYSQYINMRITFVDDPYKYEPIKIQLFSKINKELDNINKLIGN